MAVYEQLMRTYEGMFDIENGGGGGNKKNYQTLTEMKSSKAKYFISNFLKSVKFYVLMYFLDLYENGGGRNHQDIRTDLTPEEANALKRFKEQDGIMVFCLFGNFKLILRKLG